MHRGEQQRGACGGEYGAATGEHALHQPAEEKFFAECRHRVQQQDRASWHRWAVAAPDQAAGGEHCYAHGKS